MTSGKRKTDGHQRKKRGDKNAKGKTQKEQPNAVKNGDGRITYSLEDKATRGTSHAAATNNVDRPRM